MTEAEDIHRSVENAFNAGDTAALVDLYEEGAAMATPDGTFVNGRDAIREQWSGFVALGGNIQMTTRYAVVVGDTALLSNDWLFTGAGMELSSRTAEVARRQPDGTWKYVIDHPYAAADLPAE
jgi:ketosteroid isomerase-like protein